MPMNRLKIVADNTVPYLKGIAEPFADMVYLNAKEFTPEAVRDADALIVRSIDKCTKALLQGSRVKLIATATIGFDHIDARYCDEAGITWKNAPGCNAVSVSQYVLASLVALACRRNEPLEGKTIGIVGVGHVGKEVEKRCAALGLRILRNDPPRAAQEGPEDFVSLDRIAEEADIITLHTPLTKEGPFATYHLAGSDFFSRLKKQPWFINSCRGAVHDTTALLDARRKGRIGALLLDCWENEPEIDRRLLEAADIATPHIAGFSADGKANGTRACLEHIGRFFHQTVEKIGEVRPPAPADPVIDLDRFATDRVATAILAAFDPQPVDRALRESPEQFEAFRTHYRHPREYSAYTVRHATPREADILKKIGFRIEE